MTRPICFMVMPFGVKSVHPPVEGAPDSVDFDVLWQSALCPVIENLGYQPVRADQDISAGIIVEMLERLYFSDLVIADMTIPNGNVYYEIGIRHACRRQGCVLISAAWARPLFDLAQMRRITYPLQDTCVDEEQAVAIQHTLGKGIAALAAGDSPMYQSISGFPDEAQIDPQRAARVRGQLQVLSDFQAAARAARAALDKRQRRALALEILKQYPPEMPVSTSVAIEILKLLRDCVDWQAVHDYIGAAPEAFRNLAYVREQDCLAQSKSGNHLQAIGALSELVEHSGATSERLGLIAGRYKSLSDEAAGRGDQFACANYRDLAIDTYEQAMRLDLNDFYPSSNLPFLYRERGQPGDVPAAHLAAGIARLACEREPDNAWARSTLLTLAFFAEDCEAAARYAAEIRKEGTAAWQLESTIDTLKRSLLLVEDIERKEKLEQVLVALETLLARH